jgi:hypothetical protein
VRRNGRFFSDYYDSTVQRLYAPVTRRSRDAKARVLGRIRLDTLLSRKLVVTDAQLLDGAFFLDQHPADLLSALRRSRLDESLPIRVRARAPQLEQALVGFIVRPDRSELQGFSYSSVERPGERHEVQKALEAIPAARVRSWNDVPTLLTEIGVEDQNVERLKEGWARWKEAQETGLIEVEVWGKAFDINQHLSLFGLASPSFLQTEVGREAAAHVFAEREGLRSSVETYLTEQRREHEGDEQVLHDLSGIAAWFNRAYNAALADSNECSVFESVWDSRFQDSGDSENEFIRLADGSTAALLNDLRIEGIDILHGLGAMPDEQFTELAFKGGTKLQAWWNQNDESKLLSALEPFALAIAEASGEDAVPIPEWVPDAAGFVAGVAAVFLGAGRLSPVEATIVNGAAVASAYVMVKYVDKTNQTKGQRRIVQRMLDVARNRAGSKESR